MVGLFVALLAMGSTFVLGRRSLGAGVVALLAWGNHYAFLRAHIYDPGAHFIFDAATLGLYMGCLGQPLSEAGREQTKVAKVWVYLLTAWPIVWLGMPFQHPLIQLVGLRAAIFFVPCVLLGARMSDADVRVIARGFVALNLVAAGFATVQYVYGLEAVMPLNAVTRNMYAAIDVAGYEYHRITASFVSSHAYGGMMLASVPFLLARLLASPLAKREQLLLTVGLLVAGVGIFACGARSPVVKLFLLLGMMLLTGGLRWRLIVPLAIGGAVTSHAVLNSERLQRFTSLEDTSYVSDRVGSSLNQRFIDVWADHPIGEGLGSGHGTSIPYFLADLAPQQIGLENEYSRILMELGPIGLLVWAAFVARTVTANRGPPIHTAPRLAGYLRFCAVLQWGTALIGTGTLTAIPESALLLLTMGLLLRYDPQRFRVPMTLSASSSPVTPTSSVPTTKVTA